MALDHKDYARTAAFFSGEMTKEEQVAFEAWRQQNPAEGTSIDELRVIWENSGIRATDAPLDTEAEWANLQRTIRRRNEKEFPLKDQKYPWLKIAATLLMVLAAGVWLFRDNENVNQLATANGSTTVIADEAVETFFLPDSSRIWLNLGSSLTYDGTFGKKERRVRIKGEGFFKVSPDKSRPFIIETDKALVRVVGTSFNVREDDGGVVLTVEEGLVRFTPQDGSPSNRVMVTAGETARLTKKGSVTKEKSVQAAYGVWRMKSNPLYEIEKSNPQGFIHPRFDWRKNSINQSVIEGKIGSSSELAVYRNIVLRVAYTNAKGREMETEFQVAGPLRPGDELEFEKRLFDIFRDTRTMNISVKSAEVAVNE